MRIVAAILVSIGLAGCVGPEAFEAELEGWVGRTEVEIVDAWGPPDQVYENEAGRYLTWRSSRIRLVPGQPQVYHWDRTGSRSRATVSGGIPPRLMDMTCRKTMILRNGVITRWQWDGNSCY